MFFGTKRIKSQNETYLWDTPLKNKKRLVFRGALLYYNTIQTTLGCCSKLTISMSV